MKCFLWIIAVVAVGGCASTSTNPVQSALVEQAIRHAIAKEMGELIRADLEKVETLNLVYYPISDADLMEVAKLP